eukprot:3495169-Prymnesium_polylepis.1
MPQKRSSRAASPARLHRKSEAFVNDLSHVLTARARGRRRAESLDFGQFSTFESASLGGREKARRARPYSHVCANMYTFVART